MTSAQVDRLGVGIGVRRRVGVHDPDVPLVGHRQVGIVVEREERHRLLGALHDVTTHQDAAVAVELAGDQQVHVPEAPREEGSAEVPAELDASLTVVGERRLSRCSLEVELVRGGVHDDEVHVVDLPVVDPRLIGGRLPLGRDVFEREQRSAVGRDRVHLGGDRPEPVRVHEVLVLPGARLLTDAALRHLAARHHQDASLAVDLVAVHIHVVEVVVLPDPLDGLEVLLQDRGTPQADVRDRCRVRAHVVGGHGRLEGPLLQADLRRDRTRAGSRRCFAR